MAKLFVAIFEGELGDAGFVKIAEIFLNYAVELFFVARARAVDQRQDCARVRAGLRKCFSQHLELTYFLSLGGHVKAI